MSAHERDSYDQRLTAIYAEQLQGMRDGLLAVNRNVLLYIAEGRERGTQIDAMVKQLGACADELGALRQIKAWQRWLCIALIILACGVIALLIKVF